LDLLNASKVEGQPDNERAQALRAGAIHLEKAFNANMRNAAAANALCELLLRKNQHKRVWSFVAD
jgi:RNA polymerase-associated protein CTR9